MLGKDVCKRLKAYRIDLAKANGIDFQPKECNFEGKCPGYCPACDEEIRYLENELRKKEENGESIKLEWLIKLAFEKVDTVDNIDSKEFKKRLRDKYKKEYREINDGFFLGWIVDPSDDW